MDSKIIYSIRIFFTCIITVLLLLSYGLYASAEGETITVALPRHAEPFSADNKDYKKNGVVPEYYEHLSEKTGFNFKCVYYDTSKEAAEAVSSGKNDILGFFYGDEELAAEYGLNVTDPYLSLNSVRITRHGFDEDDVETIALTERTIAPVRKYYESLGEHYNYLELISSDDCYDAVVDGKADAAIVTVGTATWIANQHSLNRITLTTFPGFVFHLRGCVKGNPDFLEKLNTGIHSAQAELQKIVTEYSVTDQSDFYAVIENIPPYYLVTVIAVLIVLLIVLAVVLIRLHINAKEKAALMKEREETHRRRLEIENEEKANEERSVFFATISHDMRTSLNAIIGFSELALREDGGEKIIDYLKKINISGKILLDLVNDTLTVSRLESSKMLSKSEPVNMKEFFNVVCVPIRERASDAELTFNEDTDFENFTAVCDRKGMQKVFLNLLNNAVKYTPKGGTVTLSVNIEDGEESQKILVGNIIDTGVGMSEDFLPHVFEPFSQENSASSGGVGLGLLIVKKTVDMMGGTISVTSRKNEGSTFTVRIPLTLSEENIHTDEGTDMSNARTSLKGLHILMCEDNPLNTELTVTILNMQGAEVDTAENGKLGMELFEKKPAGTYDCILMDLRMPVMNGYEASAAIRNLERPDAKTIPIIALSADLPDEDTSIKEKAHIDGHITKPIQIDILQKKLAGYIKK